MCTCRSPPGAMGCSQSPLPAGTPKGRCWLWGGGRGVLGPHLCDTWEPRRLDMVSSRFCRRSSTFCTVLFLWDSGSAGGQGGGFNGMKHLRARLSQPRPSPGPTLPPGGDRAGPPRWTQVSISPHGHQMPPPGVLWPGARAEGPEAGTPRPEVTPGIPTQQGQDPAGTGTSAPKTPRWEHVHTCTHPLTDLHACSHAQKCVHTHLETPLHVNTHTRVHAHGLGGVPAPFPWQLLLGSGHGSSLPAGPVG